MTPDPLVRIANGNCDLIAASMVSIIVERLQAL
jgi:hypothetical protein